MDYRTPGDWEIVHGICVCLFSRSKRLGRGVDQHRPLSRSCLLVVVYFIPGEDEKQTCKISPAELNSLLKSLNENAIVFLDGVMKSKDEGILTPCLEWRDLKKPSHRLVCICSMVSFRKYWCPERYTQIPVTVTTPLLKCKSAAPDPGEPENDSVDEFGVLIQEDDERKTAKDQSLFWVASWNLDEYEQAVVIDDFFEHVRAKFTDSEGSVSIKKRMELLEGEFSIGGGCARLMFDADSSEKTAAISAALDATPDIAKYIDGSLDVMEAPGAVTQLYSWYVSPGNRPQPCLLSRYVMRNLGMKLGPAYIYQVAKAFDGQRQTTNPEGPKRARYN